MVSRRRLLAGVPALLAGVAGCNALGGEGLPLEDIEFELVNNDDEEHVFHYAFESEGGVAGWRSRSVPGNDATVIERDGDAVSRATHLNVVVAGEARRHDLTVHDDAGLIMVEYWGPGELEVDGVTEQSAAIGAGQ